MMNEDDACKKEIGIKKTSDGKSSYCLWQGLLKRILKCMNRNLVGSIYGRSSIKNAHFVPIG
jgi:hypothetical protein